MLLACLFIDKVTQHYPLDGAGGCHCPTRVGDSVILSSLEHGCEAITFIRRLPGRNRNDYDTSIRACVG